MSIIADAIHMGDKPLSVQLFDRSVGAEFKVMQELMRHSSLRSTIDIYTQAVTPAKRAAQASVLSLVFPAEPHVKVRSRSKKEPHRRTAA